MDERFKHVGKDPLFKPLRKHSRKVQIDDRFKQMFTDDRFILKHTKDKRGRNIKKSSGDDLKRFYSIKEDNLNLEQSDAEEDSQKQNNKPKGKKQGRTLKKKLDEPESDSKSEKEEQLNASDDSNDEEASFKDEEDDDHEEAKGSTDESELSSSSDESDSEEEDEDGQQPDIDKINYDWQPLDHDAEKADKTYRRLAIQNLDWDHLDVKDIYTLVNSVRTPISVKIYISDFGKERLAKEEVEGPRELVEMPKIDEEEEEYRDLSAKMDALKNPGARNNKVNEYEDCDEMIDTKNEELRERIRRYQLNRMKYFYAIVEFDSVESAELVYKELDGLDYEGSSLELDLRYVPDDIDFDSTDLRAECDKAPDLTTYKAPLFINSALQQTTVRFTWDETDINRQEQLRRAYTKEELEKDDLEAYLASDSDEEDENEEVQDDGVSVVTVNSEARINKYRDLLKKLEEEEDKKKKLDVDVEWGDYDGDEQQTSRIHDETDPDEATNENDDDYEFPDDDESGDEEGDSNFDDGESELDISNAKKMNSCKEDNKKGTKRKSKKRNKKEEMNDEQIDPELSLFGLDVDANEKEFRFDPDDNRFEAVYESGLYNIDPSHPNFKRTSALEMIAERKRERRSKKLKTR